MCIFRPEHATEWFQIGVGQTNFFRTDLDQLPEPIYFKPARPETKEPMMETERPNTLVINIKQMASEEDFFPLVCSPANLLGFVLAFSRKFLIEPQEIRGLFKNIGNSGHVEQIDEAFFKTMANKTFLIQVCRYIIHWM